MAKERTIKRIIKKIGPKLLSVMCKYGKVNTEANKWSGQYMKDNAESISAAIFTATGISIPPSVIRALGTICEKYGVLLGDLYGDSCSESESGNVSSGSGTVSDEGERKSDSKKKGATAAILAVGVVGALKFGSAFV